METEEVIALILLVIIFVLGFSVFIYHLGMYAGYRDGQVDYMNGEVNIELEVDSTYVLNQ